MKKLFVLAIVALVAVGGVFAEGVTKDASGGDSLVLTANVGYRLYATFDGTVNFDVNAFGEKAAGTNTATLNIISNRKAWTLSFTSLNDGKLVSADATLKDLIPYEVKLTTANATWLGLANATGLGSFEALAKNTAKTLVASGGDARTSTAGVDYTLEVKVLQPVGAALWEEGVYSDTITVSVTAS